MDKILGYRTLTSDEVQMVNSLKEAGNRFGELIEELKKNEAYDPRWLAIGATHMQQGLMALIRAVTKPESF